MTSDEELEVVGRWLMEAGGCWERQLDGSNRSLQPLGKTVR